MNYDNVKFEKPIGKGELHIGCLNCSTASYKLSMDRILSVGFGLVKATKNGESVYEDTGSRYRILVDGKWKEYDMKDAPLDGCEWLDAWTIERMANKDPFNDWKITFNGPMHGETYQRQGYMHWPCIESNQGFA
jgi:hypothetical protein